MKKRSMLVVLAAGLLLFTVWALAERAAIWTDSPSAYPEYRETAGDAQQRLPALSVQQAIKAAKNQQPCSNKQGSNASDLCAEWRAADAAERASRWGWYQLWLSTVGVFGLLVTLWFNLQAWRQARHANAIAEETARHQLRAYVAVRKARLRNVAVGQVPEFSCEYWNLGQTPAFEFRQYSNGFHGTAAKSMGDVKVRRSEAPDGYSISQLGAGTGTSRHWHQAFARPLTQELYEALVRGDMVLGVWGICSYRDIYKRRHITTFKFMLLPESLPKGMSGMAICHRGNHAN